MNDIQSLAIENQLDIIEARMRVRLLARDSGLDLFDQARISLATSTLAIILGLEKAGTGIITMHPLAEAGRTGVRVVCIKHRASQRDLAAGVLDDARRMVDELRVEERPEGSIHVSLVKWAGRSKRLDSLAGALQAATPIGD